MRRGRLEIVADILTQASRGANKTRIVYRPNLNFKNFEKYLSFLLDKKFLVVIKDPSGELYKTTDKGKAFLADYRRVKEALV